MDEKFNLNWNDFQTNATDAFRQLRNENIFEDVTLVSSDLMKFSAHRIVLSSCSDYFGAVLKENQGSQHPLLCLDNVTSKSVQQMLDYIYLGEIQLFQSDIEKFMNVADRFQIKGLFRNENSTAEQYDVKNSFEINDSIDSKDEMGNNDNYLISTRTTAKPEFSVRRYGNNLEITDLENLRSEQYVKVSIGLFACRMCGKLFKKSRDIKEHVDIHIEGLIFPCQSCHKQSSTQKAIRLHKNKCSNQN